MKASFCDNPDRIGRALITKFIFIQHFMATCAWIRCLYNQGWGAGAPGAAWFGRSRSWSHFIFL